MSYNILSNLNSVLPYIINRFIPSYYELQEAQEVICSIVSFKGNVFVFEKLFVVSQCPL